MNKIEEIKKKILKSFEGLHFDEETHTYTWNGKTLNSTTSYISRFSENFKSFWASEAKGKKILSENPNDARTGTYYRKRWKYLKDEAQNMGSRVHLYAECYPNFDKPMCYREQGVLDFFEWLPDNYVVLFSELRIFDKKDYKAGTVDLVLYNTKTGKLVLVDWKTNTRHILESYKRKKLKAPFSDLIAHNLNKYSLQMSDYSNMINKNTEFEIEELWLPWLTNKTMFKKDSDRSKDYVISRVKPFVNEKNFKLYKLVDYSERIEDCIKKHRSQLKKDTTPAKVKKGLFSKKPKNGFNMSKKKKSSFATIIKNKKKNG